MSSAALPAGVAAGASRGVRGSDERLARRVGSGDMRAFAAIYQRYHQSLFGYCLSILRDEADAQDALQSTFERALCALRQANRSAPLRPWLYRIAHNEAITVIRRRTPNLVPDYVGAVHERSAAHVAEERDRLSTLVSDLAQLPDRPRSALVMRELIGLSHQDIAIALNTTLRAAKQAIFEARQALAEAMEGREMSCDGVREVISDGDGRVLRGRRIRAHLRGCAGCAEFADAIAQRRTGLRALAPPLAPVVAASILARASAGIGGHATVGGVSAAGGSAGGVGVGKGALAGMIGSKAAVGAAVIATAGLAGVATIEPLAGRHRAGPAHPPSAMPAPAVPAHRAASGPVSRTVQAPAAVERVALRTVSTQGRVVRVRLAADRRRETGGFGRDRIRERPVTELRSREVVRRAGVREVARDRAPARREFTTRMSARETRDRSPRVAPVRRREDVSRPRLARISAN